MQVIQSFCMKTLRYYYSKDNKILVSKNKIEIIVKFVQNKLLLKKSKGKCKDHNFCLNETYK